MKKTLITTAKIKKLQKGLKLETFHAADVHATNRLCKGHRHGCFNSGIYGEPQPGLEIKCDVSLARTGNNFFSQFNFPRK